MDTQEKCSTCMIRYVCEEKAGYDCKHNNYRDYMKDGSETNFFDGDKMSDLLNEYYNAGLRVGFLRAKKLYGIED